MFLISNYKFYALDTLEQKFEIFFCLVYPQESCKNQLVEHVIIKKNYQS